MPIRTKRWNDPKLGPSKELHAAVYTTGSSPIPWPAYRARYLAEQRPNRELIADLARSSNSGETITLLCSSACERESRCHRSILKELIEGMQSEGQG
jgi:uncharacterized protein YeaO (DUF488 family)